MRSRTFWFSVFVLCVSCLVAMGCPQLEKIAFDHYIEDSLEVIAASVDEAYEQYTYDELWNHFGCRCIACEAIREYRGL